MVRRIMFRNERSLFNRACDKCGKNIVAMYPKDYISPVYCNECWFSDSWNPLERGREYDFKTIFFEQVSDLYKSVPKAAVIRFHTNINSEYSNFIADDRNVYLSYSVSEGENIAYCANTDKSRDCLDSFFINNSELCYQNVDSSNNYHGIYLIRSRSCVDSNFLFDCINCQNCFMSSNLRNQRFIFRNKQLSEKEYFERLKEADIGNYQALTQMTKEFEKLIKKSLHKFANLTKVVNCTGDNILNSRNSDNIFHSYNCENTKHAARIFDTKDSVGIVAPLIYFEKGYEFHKERYKEDELGKVIWYAGGEIDWDNVLAKHRGVDEIDIGQYSQVSETEFASGCAFLISAEVIKNLGMFDEKYFLYYEDSDLSMRIRRKGYKIYFNPKSLVWHKNASSAGGSGSTLQDYYITRNRLLFALKYAPIRSKIAVLRESMALMFGGRKWQKRAVIDFYSGKFGKGSYPVT